MGNDFLELEEFDKKYTMKAYLLTTGKVDMYVIDPKDLKEPIPNWPLKIGEKNIFFYTGRFRRSW